MPDLSSFTKLILDKISDLTKNQKRVAQFLLDYPEEIAFSSIDILADKLSVGKATIVRLAQSLGYKGFLELKTDLSNKLRDDLSPKKKFSDTVESTTAESDFLAMVSENEIENIHLTLERLDRSAFNGAVDILFETSRIYTIGLGISSFLAQLAAYCINRITMKANAFTHESVNFHDQIVSINPGDSLIAISLPPYSVRTIEAAENCQQNGIKVISITDEIVAPIAQFSDIVLPVRTYNIVFVNTVSAIMVTLYALAIGIGLRDREKSVKILSLFENVKIEFGINVRTDCFKKNE